MIKTVSYKDYQIAKAIYKNIKVLSADDKTAKIKIEK